MPTRARDKLLPSFLKMAAIATIADAVPLVRRKSRDCRARSARTSPARRRRPARALCGRPARSCRNKPITGFDVAFRIAPRINAAGRMDVASEIIELFCTRDTARANELANKTGAPQSRAPRHRSIGACRH